MRFLYFVFIFVFINKFSFSQSEEGLVKWLTITEAQELNKKQPKPFLVDIYTDWCGWCKRLQYDVFSKPEFVAWAQKNVILLELDFPRTKQLPAELAQQNSGMQQALKVTGYPTCWLLFTAKDAATNNFSLNPVGSLGYPSGAEQGKEQVLFLENANRIMGQIKVN